MSTEAQEVPSYYACLALISMQNSIFVKAISKLAGGRAGPGDSVLISASMDGKVLSELSKGVPEEACSAL